MFGRTKGPSPSIYRPTARQPGIALIHLYVRVTLLEVDEMIVARDPRRHVVGDLVDLGSEAFMLDEATEGFGVTDQSVLRHRGDEHAGAEGALIVLTGDRVHLTGTLEVDVFSLTLIRIESVETALHDEARQADELSEGTDLLLGGMPHGVFLLGLGRSESVRSLGFESAGVEGVVGLILAVLVLAKGGLFVHIR
jgi:hypothetical protein